MKKIVLILIFTCFSLQSQDIEPAQTKFKLGDTSDITKPYIFLSADSNYFKQHHFILGWAWSNGKKMSECLYDNQGHVDDVYYPASGFKDSTSIIIDLTEIYNKDCNFAVSWAQSIVYSPVLPITNPESQQNLRIGDPRNSIFGFRHINPFLYYFNINNKESD